MAKVVIEFDPAIPAEREGVAVLFSHIRASEPKASSHQSPNDKPASVASSKSHLKTEAPATKTCETCGKKFERPKLYSNPVWAKRRFCSRQCGGAGQRNASLLSNDDSQQISSERDGNGKTKYCQKCGMYMWKVYDHRRSAINPDLCDSCGGDLKREDDFSSLQAIDPSRMGEVGR